MAYPRIKKKQKNYQASRTYFLTTFPKLESTPQQPLVSQIDLSTWPKETTGETDLDHLFPSSSKYLH